MISQTAKIVVSSVLGAVLAFTYSYISWLPGGPMPYPFKLIADGASILGIVISGNVHQPSPIGVWSFLIVFWVAFVFLILTALGKIFKRSGVKKVLLFIFICFCALGSLRSEETSLIEIKRVSMLYDGGSIVVDMREGDKRWVLHRSPLLSSKAKFVKYSEVASTWRLETQSQLDQLPVLDLKSKQAEQLVEKLRKLSRLSKNKDQKHDAQILVQMLTNPQSDEAFYSLDFKGLGY